MLRYTCKRLLMLIPIMLGVLIIIFAIRAITPGNPLDSLLGEDASEEQRAALSEQLGLNDPLPVQFIKYVGGVLTGNLGTSYKTKQPVLQEILQRLPTTIIVCFTAVALGVLVGVPMGIYSATRPYSVGDSIVLVISMAARAIPGFVLAFLLLSLFSVKLHWLPSYGVTDPRGYILPMLTIGLASAANYTRLTRTSMLDIIRKDYIRTARAKGVSEGKVIFSHALRNASIPIVASIGNQIGHQLGGALIIETVFGIPGIGKYIGDAITARNFPAIQGGVLVLALIFTLVNLLVDLSFTVINPQLKTSMVASAAKKKKPAKA